MKTELKILKIVMEDILRVLAETENGVPLEFVKSEVKASDSIISKAVNRLKKDNMISEDKRFFHLTPRGKNKAKDILKKHLSLEKYFKNIKSKKQAHDISHFFEHYISREVLDNLKKLSTFRGEGILLTIFEGEECFITDITLDPQLFERIISMGIFPGEKVRILTRLHNGVVLKIKSKKCFIAWEIARNIRVLEDEKT